MSQSTTKGRMTGRTQSVGRPQAQSWHGPCTPCYQIRSPHCGREEAGAKKEVTFDSGEMERSKARITVTASSASLAIKAREFPSPKLAKVEVTRFKLLGSRPGSLPLTCSRTLPQPQWHSLLRLEHDGRARRDSRTD